MKERDFVRWVKERWDEKEATKPIRDRLSKDPVYLAACLMGEAAEAWDVIKKPHRARVAFTTANRDELILELGDTYHYLVKLAEVFDIPMSAIRARNRAKLEERDESEREPSPGDDWRAIASGILDGIKRDGPDIRTGTLFGFGRRLPYPFGPAKKKKKTPSRGSRRDRRRRGDETRTVRGLRTGGRGAARRSLRKVRRQG